ncbi:hypothetical protein EYF80_007769 [Liparis tanakae]|uniref:Uncharacterized protein n=1 Tax=Liparis tanakae TaxID=230148 RepID=A0A4Z2IXZ7_9TELE|nr:hypothetical protein EYF80_007769 [Liparis tanakae]
MGTTGQSTGSGGGVRGRFPGPDLAAGVLGAGVLGSEFGTTLLITLGMDRDRLPSGRVKSRIRKCSSSFTPNSFQGTLLSLEKSLFLSRLPLSLSRSLSFGLSFSFFFNLVLSSFFSFFLMSTGGTILFFSSNTLSKGSGVGGEADPDET